LAIAWIVRLLGSWKVLARIRLSISAGFSFATSAGVRATSKSRRDVGSETSSSVRIVITHATRISNGEP
jgi:hypothetical protein